MKIFQAIGDKLSYNDILQLDGAYSVSHINYGEGIIPLLFSSKCLILMRLEETTNIFDRMFKVFG